MSNPQSIALQPQFLILNALFCIHLPQLSLIQPPFSIFNSSSSIISRKNGIFDSKSPQNSVISDKMSASAACTACSFFQVCLNLYWNILEASLKHAWNFINTDKISLTSLKHPWNFLVTHFTLIDALQSKYAINFKDTKGKKCSNTNGRNDWQHHFLSCSLQQKITQYTVLYYHF